MDEKPVQRFRVDQQLWEEFGAKCAELDSDRSKELRKFISWFVGRPKARRPIRPE